jgi:hypothetical protein
MNFGFPKQLILLKKYETGEPGADRIELSFFI